MGLDTDDRRTRILDAAETLFAERGYDATPTARIAESARVPKGLVFYHFPRKIDLLLTLLEERLPSPGRTELSGVVVVGDPAGSLLRLHERLGLDRHASLVLRSIIFREAGTHPEVAERTVQLRRDLVDLAVEVLRAALGRSGRRADAALIRSAGATFAAAMFDHANTSRIGLDSDLGDAARVVARAVGSPDSPVA